MYNYNFYGLRLESAIEMLELPISNSTEEPTVSLSWGQVSRPINGIENAQYKPDSVAHREFYFLEVDDIARYYVEGKDHITIEKLANTTEKDVVAFLIDTVLTVVLLKLNRFVFHASAISGPRGAVMICGHAGIGKSAIALRLIDQGYGFIEDDRCLLQWDEASKKVLIHNHLPFIDVWSNDKKKIEHIEGATILHAIRDQISKLRVDVQSFVDTAPVPLDKVIILTTQNDIMSPNIKKLSGLAKCSWVKGFTHMEHLIPYVSDASLHFGYIMNLLSTVPVISVRRSNKAKPKEVVEFIIDEILSKDIVDIKDSEEA